MTLPDTPPSSTVDVDGLAEGTPMPPTPLLCRCGHPRDLHEHYRSGRDCGFCGKRICPQYRPPGRWARWARQVTRVDRDLAPLLAELARLRAAERGLRNVIALHPYNPGPAT